MKEAIHDDIDTSYDTRTGSSNAKVPHALTEQVTPL